VTPKHYLNIWQKYLVPYLIQTMILITNFYSSSN